MKKSFLKVIALVMAAAMLFSLTVSAADDFSVQPENTLQFGEDGKFRILQLADTQDDMFPSPGMIKMIETAVEKYEPDLVIFTGDNTGTVDLKMDAKYAIKAIIDPIAEAGIPFTFVFGNHDAENVSKETHYAAYRDFDNCLAYDADPEIYGMGTHNLTIKSSDGTKVAYNLWMFDSNMYDPAGGYDYIHEDQLAWYVNTSNALKAANGGEPVPSIAFQHIVPYEIKDYVVEVSEPDPNGFTSVNQDTGEKHHFALDPNYTEAGSILRENPCPSRVHGEQMSKFVQQGDVNAVFVGHDHVNDYIVHTTMNAADGNAIDIVNTPGASFQSYGDEEMRGCRIIDLDENNPWEHETFSPTFYDVVGDTEETRALAYVSDNIVWYYVSFIARIVPFFGEQLQQLLISAIYNAFK
ncbi:MAG: metallophosphoesterase [Clostridia bacterium]|nr:metallophosphoesterase [Clostridia bacterium]